MVDLDFPTWGSPSLRSENGTEDEGTSNLNQRTDLGGAMPRKCHRCHVGDHRERDCPRKRLRAVPDPEPQPAPAPEVSDPWDLSNQQPVNQQPDLAAAYAYWDTTAPLVSIYEAWDGPGSETPATIAREMRLRTEAARQVAESRAARGVL